MSVLGKTQIAILRTVSGGRWFIATKRGVQRSCLNLHDRGLLARDPKRVDRWTSSEAGDAAIFEHDDDLDRRSGWGGERVAERRRRAPYAGAE